MKAKPTQEELAAHEAMRQRVMDGLIPTITKRYIRRIRGQSNDVIDSADTNR